MMSLAERIRQCPFLFNTAEISLDFLGRLTDTTKIIKRSVKYGIGVTHASQQNVRRLTRSHRRKSVIIIPVEDLVQVRRWEAFAGHLLNGIPAYQKIYSPHHTSEFFTSWYFAQRYLFRVCKLEYDDIATLLIILNGDTGITDVRRFLAHEL